ncbi:NnrU family protein [Methylocystis sp.]|uniref:NnrU family protein n=1 Tax=Methylocystis sp. TaxID=1911079 RepID=UPI0025E2E802|nr:NnrU family protein [Methylocystis sp.]
MPPNHFRHVLSDPRRGRGIGLIEQFGLGPFKGVYSLVALVGFALIVWGFSRYRALKSRHDDRRATEVAIAIKSLNRMNELGRAKFVRRA